MQEVEDGVLLLGIVLVAVRGIDGQAAVDAEHLAVIPGVADGSALVGLHIILSTLTGDEEHVEETGAVTLDEDVLRIVDGNAIHNEIVGVDLRGRERELDGPDVVGATDHIDGAAVRVGHPRAAELDDGGIIGAEAEGHAVALDFRGDDGRAATAEIEVSEFLSLHGHEGCHTDGDGCK